MEGIVGNGKDSRRQIDLADLLRELERRSEHRSEIDFDDVLERLDRRSRRGRYRNLSVGQLLIIGLRNGVTIGDLAERLRSTVADVSEDFASDLRATFGTNRFRLGRPASPDTYDIVVAHREGEQQLQAWVNAPQEELYQVRALGSGWLELEPIPPLLAADGNEVVEILWDRLKMDSLTRPFPLARGLRIVDAVGMAAGADSWPEWAVRAEDDLAPDSGAAEIADLIEATYDIYGDEYGRRQEEELRSMLDRATRRRSA